MSITSKSAGEIGLTVLNSVLTIFGTIANLLVCIVILKNEELQNGLDLLIANLCFVDLAVCLLAQPMYIFYLNDLLTDNSMVDAFLYLSLTTMHAVAINLMCIAINRMLAIAHPFTNTFMVSKFKILMVICGIWIASICLAVFSKPNTEKASQIFSQVSHVLIIGSFLLCYLRIFWTARKQQRKINIQMQSVIHNHRQVRLYKANRATTTTLLIVISLMVCFFPDTVYDLHPDYDVMEERKKWLFSLLFFSCSMNPCIYMWRTDTFKAAAKKTFRFN